jgi:hypothetical protein
MSSGMWCHDLLRQKPTSDHIAGMEFSLTDLPNDAIHVLGFSGEDGGTSNMKLNVVSQATQTCLVVQDGCAADAPSTWRPRNGQSVQCKPCRTHPVSYTAPYPRRRHLHRRRRENPKSYKCRFVR